MTTAIKFGPTEAPRYKRIPVEFSYFRDENLESQTFQVLDKRVDVNAANQMLQRTKGGDADAFSGLVTLIGKYMDDKDGTGAKWKPVELAPKKTDSADAPRRFRGPDGKIYPWDKAEAFLEVPSGSSRRRWLYLMNEDDEAAVEEDTLVKLLEFLMELAGKDRTLA